ncbi:MAG: hypothetical protein QOI21_410 [Actinomycetota bacterium]|jgi:DNA-binding transcriptional LysR family regulator|nr:hypothetical protein [Actinomycetota bacterium]
MHGVWGALDKALLAIRRNHPGVKIRLRQVAASGVFKELTESNLDIAIIALPDEPVAEIITHEISSEPLVLVAGSEIALPSGELTVRDFASIPYIDVSPAWALRNIVDRTFAAAGITRNSSFELTDINAAVELVRSGLGVTIVPRSLAERFFSADIYEIRPASPPWRIGIAHLEDAASPIAEMLIEEIRTAVRRA